MLFIKNKNKYVKIMFSLLLNCISLENFTYIQNTYNYLVFDHDFMIMCELFSHGSAIYTG